MTRQRRGLRRVALPPSGHQAMVFVGLDVLLLLCSSQTLLNFPGSQISGRTLRSVEGLVWNVLGAL